MTGRVRIAIPLFPRFTALDAIGPPTLRLTPARVLHDHGGF
jgi:hypothetical protein